MIKFDEKAISKCLKKFPDLCDDLFKGADSCDDMFISLDEYERGQKEGKRQQYRTVDMLAFDKSNCLNFIEFKAPDEEVLEGKGLDSAPCAKDGSVQCEDLKRVKSKLVKMTRAEITTSARLKAIESWLLVNNELLKEGSSLADSDSECRFRFVVGKPLDVASSINRALAGCSDDEGERLCESVKRRLSLYRKSMSKGRNLFYDKVDCHTPDNFMKYVFPSLCPMSSK